MKSLLWLGAWLIVLPSLGISGGWKETLTIITGVVLLAVVLRRGGFLNVRRLHRASSEKEMEKEPSSKSSDGSSSNTQTPL